VVLFDCVAIVRDASLFHSKECTSETGRKEAMVMVRLRCFPPHRRGIPRPPCGTFAGPASAGPAAPLLSALLFGAAWLALISAPASAQDPSNTVTVWVHGFSGNGSVHQGVFGDDYSLDSAAGGLVAMAGLPVLTTGMDPPPPNVVGATNYYGDTPPSYYTEADLAELHDVMVRWDGGVPRYALIVAKYAKHLLERTGAAKVNFVSGSFGSLIVRWIIEKDVDGLASQGKIARWLSVEGIVDGNWAASRGETLGLLQVLGLGSIDLHHMSYGWVDANLHPRRDADNPLYAGILMGAVGCTDDTDNDSALSLALTKIEHFRPNDSIQLVEDSHFAVVTDASRFMGMPPTLSFFHSTHDAIARHPAALAQAANFLTQSRRVTVTMTSATVFDLHEPQQWYWDWRPAEVILECRTYSPAIAARWGITEAASCRGKEGAEAPIRRYRHGGETQSFREVFFDDFVLSDETELVLDLHAEEVDNNWRYGVFESAVSPSYDDLGVGTLRVSTLRPGTYSFRAGDWACTFDVSIFDYPFGATLAGKPRVARDPALPLRASLELYPNPSSSTVRISAAALTTAAAEQPATLSILDVSGRLVRRMTGPAGAGFEWDGRDDDGRLVPPGVYVHRLETTGQTLYGRSLRLR
jgi:hypothetical protein